VGSVSAKNEKRDKSEYGILGGRFVFLTLSAPLDQLRRRTVLQRAIIDT
jgi:hypothetical protein